MKLIDIKTVRDERGFLIEYLTGEELKAMGMKFGMVYVASIRPGKARGNHYHKRRTELISYVGGRVKVSLFDMAKGKRQELILDSQDKEIRRLVINPGVAHLFENNFEETAILISHSSESAYDKEDDYSHSLN